tara:strand:- start:620 stop:1288 length:669 start_codon:yes stop_codon:yes gene_type:complete
MKNKVLIVAAHPDDEILGCGGTILRHTESKDDVQIVFVSDGEISRDNSSDKKIKRYEAAKTVSKELGCKEPIFLDFPDNQLDTVPLLKIIKLIESIIDAFKPNIVYTHFYNDLNIDHQITSKAVLTACRPIGEDFVKQILLFEIPSSTEWSISSSHFRPNKYISIANFSDKKRKILKNYENEIRNFPHPRSFKYISSIEAIRGSEAGLDEAEAFLIFKEVQP